MTKLSINMHDAKTNLSKYIKEVVQLEGRTITICNNGEPVAEIVPIKSKKDRIFGTGKGLFGKGAAEIFLEELSDEEFPGIGLRTAAEIEADKKKK